MIETSNCYKRHVFTLKTCVSIKLIKSLIREQEVIQINIRFVSLSICDKTLKLNLISLMICTLPSS
jgi:hypothetical protein